MMVIFYPMELVYAERDLSTNSVKLEFVLMMVDSGTKILTQTLAVSAPLDSLELIVNLVRTEISTNRPNSS